MLFYDVVHHPATSPHFTDINLFKLLLLPFTILSTDKFAPYLTMALYY